MILFPSFFAAGLPKEQSTAREPELTENEKSQLPPATVATVATNATAYWKGQHTRNPSNGETSSALWCCVCGSFPYELRDGATFRDGASFYCVKCLGNSCS